MGILLLHYDPDAVYSLLYKKNEECEARLCELWGTISDVASHWEGSRASLLCEQVSVDTEGGTAYPAGRVCMYV